MKILLQSTKIVNKHPKTWKKIGEIKGNIKIINKKEIINDTIEKKELPQLSQVLRSLYMKIHPDHFTQYPEQQEVNEQSMMILQGFITTLKDSKPLDPPAQLKNISLEFFLRTNKPAHFQKAKLIIHYTGNNKNVLHAMFNKFFQQTKLADGFIWDPELWPKRIVTQDDLNERYNTYKAESAQSENTQSGYNQYSYT